MRVGDAIKERPRVGSVFVESVRTEYGRGYIVMEPTVLSSEPWHPVVYERETADKLAEEFRTAYEAGWAQAMDFVGRHVT